jgi:hypothetical protein
VRIEVRTRARKRRGKGAGKISMTTPKMKMMTSDDICAELGWTDSMIHTLLQDPDSPHARRDKHTGGYTYGLYRRERVLAVAQSTEGRAAKRRWDETLRGTTPGPGWTTRLGDIGRALGITAVATGRLLELLGYRSDKHVTDSAVEAGCGVRRWDGYAMFDDWHVDRAVSAIRSAAEATGEPAVADALAAAVANQQGRERVAARKREQEVTEAARREKEDAVISELRVELRALRATDPGMTLLMAVEYVTPHPAHRVALYRRCSAEDQRIGAAKASPYWSGAPRLKGFRFR